jgi:hypothetical protein
MPLPFKRRRCRYRERRHDYVTGCVDFTGDMNELQHGKWRGKGSAGATARPGLLFYDAIVRLGSRGLTLAEKPVRLVGYRVDGKDFWVATNRYDLSAEDVAQLRPRLPKAKT